MRIRVAIIEQDTGYLEKITRIYGYEQGNRIFAVKPS